MFNPFLSRCLMLRKQGLSSAKYEFTIANLNNTTEKKKQKLVVMSRPLGNYWDLRIPCGVFVIAEKWFVQFTEWMMLVAKMSQIKTITMWCKEKQNWQFFFLVLFFLWRSYLLLLSTALTTKSTDFYLYFHFMYSEKIAASNFAKVGSNTSSENTDSWPCQIL